MKEFSLRPIVAPAIFASLLALTVWAAEGLNGFKPFLQLDALLVVPLGILAIVGARYRVADLFKAVWHSIKMPNAAEASKSAEILCFAASAAISCGLLVSLVGTILLLANLRDYSRTPGRMALVLVGFLSGFFLSEFVLSPMAQKLAAQKEKV